MTRFHRSWPEVSVLDGEVSARIANGYDHRRVTACVHLGPLLPVDVAVHAIRVDARPDRRESLAREEQWRLFSVARLSNGKYRYECDVPARDDDALCDWTVHVAPVADALDAPVNTTGVVLQPR